MFALVSLVKNLVSFVVKIQALPPSPFRNNLVRLGREESGAAFVVTLGVFLFMWLVCCGVYAVGESVRRKIEIQNAADAAAYSAAVVQADFLSRVATVNRAMAWTYVQMTRRQMDFITQKWMEKTLERMEGDRKKMKEIHEDHCYGSCDGTHPSSNAGYNTFWVGLHGFDGFFAINFDDSIVLPNTIEMVAKLYTNLLKLTVPLRNAKSGASFGGFIGMDNKTQIANDKANINAMNRALMDLMGAYDTAVQKTVEEVVKANLPQDKLGEFTYVFRRQPSRDWFNILHNSKMDERRFLMFAGDYQGKSASQVFNWEVIEDKKAGGVSHWFMRAKNESQGQPETNSDSGSEGICRSYRKLSGQKKPEDTPNCKNNDIDNDSTPRESRALVSEWHHNAWAYICFPIFNYYVHIPNFFIGISALTVEGGECKWYSSSDTISSKKNCTWPVIMDLQSIPVIGNAMFPGGGRVYGDDPELVQELGWDKIYAGQRCKPVVLKAPRDPKTFFGKHGALVVGVARKATNPWDEMLGRASGVFKAFDFSSGVTHLWAVSAARAGYKEWSENNDDSAPYQLGYTPDGNDVENFRHCWNLRQTDWDALFLPVRHAYDFCEGTRGQAPRFNSSNENALNDVMGNQSRWVSLGGGTHKSWGNPAAPRGMSGSLNWSGMNAETRH